MAMMIRSKGLWVKTSEAKLCRVVIDPVKASQLQSANAKLKDSPLKLCEI